VTAFVSLAQAIFKGYVRDRQTLFFSIMFPLMFLVLFGGVFANQGTSKIDVIEIGDVQLFDSLSQGAKEAFDESFAVTTTDDRDAAIQKVKDGDATLAVEQNGDDLVVHYSEADQVQAAVAQGTLQAFVNEANLEATGKPPTYTFTPERVEDRSLTTIQFVTPGLLGWAVATSATFGAAATLVGWRTTKLLRRLRLAPVSTASIVTARIGVTMVVALGQFAIFVGLGMAAFGLKLTGSWWMAIPLLLAGTLAFMAIGLLAGSVSKTMEGATSLANFVVLPMAFLAGSFFSLDGAPGWLNGISQLLPLRHLNDGMLDVMVRGKGPEAAVQPILILLGFTVVLLLVAGKFFTWETE
jgi:ABC-2 type transport system permease protein